jgi:hypothetical protein
MTDLHPDAPDAGIGTAEAKLSEAQPHLVDTREQHTRTPLALMLPMVGVFLVGFRLSTRPRLRAITLLALVVCAVARNLVMRFPAAIGDA